ncbi:MAG: enoyl-CoA hydratase/isomerase family protein [Gammaproteobacteria bacterium]|nr:MAG: enoyl-CoA hydratase/isomerase family protein [Gammaproteobacteria bacterium]
MSASSEELAVIITERDSVGVIELNRADKFNCLSSAVHDSIEAAIDRFEASDHIRSVLICATGKHFCTGADLDEVQAYRANDNFGEFIEHGHRVLLRLERSALPVVAAVRGLCLAGGLELVLACDVVFAAEGARFGDQHAQYGLVPGWGGSQRLPRVVGQRRALDLMFSARWIDASAALNWGLANYVVADAELHSEALEYCHTLGRRSRGGIMTMKRLVHDGIQLSIDEALALEVAVAGQAMAAPDVSEGLSAFAEKRDPDFE